MRRSGLWFGTSAYYNFSGTLLNETELRKVTLGKVYVGSANVGGEGTVGRLIARGALVGLEIIWPFYADGSAEWGTLLFKWRGVQVTNWFYKTSKKKRAKYAKLIIILEPCFLRLLSFMEVPLLEYSIYY